MNREHNYSIETPDDALDFYAYLFDDVLEDFDTVKGDAVPSEEERRVRIFREALENKWGIERVNKALADEKLKGIYVRNPVEFVLRYCFECNGCESSYKKYDYDGFKALWKSLDYTPASAPSIGVESIGKQSAVTLGKLYEFVLTSSKGGAETGRAKTASITLDIQSEAESIDPMSPDAEERLKKLFAEFSASLSDASESARYYFAKYVYYLICHQILELKEILLDFTSLSPQAALDKISGISESYYGTSILAGICSDVEVSELKLGMNENKQAAKELLSALLNNLALRGSSAYREDLSPLFKKITREGKYEEVSISEALREKTAIFACGTKNEKHETYKRAIEELKISDFYGFALDFGKLYRLLFDAVSEDGENNKKDYRKKYITGILEGKYDMSRSAVMMYLASVKGALFNAEALIDDPESPFDKDSVLTLTRVNEVLDRMGYVNVGDDDTSEAVSELDNLYYELFTAEEFGPLALDALKSRLEEFVDLYGFNPIPFEIAVISAKERRKILLTEKK